MARDTAGMAFVPPARHLLRARDLADRRYADPLTVDDLAAAAGLSRAHFSREFRKAFGVSPHAYLLTRRLERAAALLLTLLDNLRHSLFLLRSYLYFYLHYQEIWKFELVDQYSF